MVPKGKFMGSFSYVSLERRMLVFILALSEVG